MNGRKKLTTRRIKPFSPDFFGVNFLLNKSSFNLVLTLLFFYEMFYINTINTSAIKLVPAQSLPAVIELLKNSQRRVSKIK